MNDSNNNNNNSGQRTFKFTNEEEQVMIECRKEAFFKRCLPLCVIGNLLLGVALKQKVISNSSGFIKFSLVTLAGYTAGKVSYINECREKVKSRLPPDSNLYKAMVLGQTDVFNVTVAPTSNNQQPPQQPEQSSGLSYEELRQRNRAPQPIDYSNLSGYDELRMRNRGVPEIAKNEENGENDSFKISNNNNNNSELNQSTTKNSKFKKNKYGDVVYED